MLTILIACLSLTGVFGRVTDEPDWHTARHEEGYCAMRGICGQRADKDVLNCPVNIPAPAPDPDLASRLQRTCPTLWSEQGGPQGRYCCTSDQVDKIQRDTAMAITFLIGCPACYHNFVHLWCVLVCSPDQSLWTNVVSVQKAASNNATVVKEVEYWVAETFANTFYDSCKDVKFGALNLRAMTFVGGGATNAQQWLEFLGAVKDTRVPPVGSPFQMYFHIQDEAPPEVPSVAPLENPLPTCGDPAFRCSCADCPSAPGCKPPPPPPKRPPPCRVGRMLCGDFALLVVYTAVVVAAGACFSRLGLKGPRQAPQLRTASGAFTPLLGVGTDDINGSSPYQDIPVEEEVVDQHGFVHLHQGGHDEHKYPKIEATLMRWFSRHGLYTARQPVLVLMVGLLVVGACMLGLVRFSVMTDPEKLWVGPTSEAARDKHEFDLDFGPFYRVEQMIVTTTPKSLSPFPPTPGGLPPIVTNDNIEIMFDIQQLVDDIKAPYVAPDGSMSNVTLQDICYKPFSDNICAIQSVLQYWQMNRELYRSEQAKSPRVVRMTPDYCFTHWSTQCRSAFESPMDPHVVLGGFPNDADQFNYTSSSTSFVVTYPVDSRPELVDHARAWEQEFIRVMRTAVETLVGKANLTVSFSAESSVQRELERESTTDAVVVGASYLVMLAYISVALAVIPRGGEASCALMAVTSRCTLGLVGVSIVALSVAGALGLMSLLGYWSTLIIMEVIPFLVLAVGVDNMFVLAHAAARQDPNLPLDLRISQALAVAGPSITLAASCETLAFLLGAITPMPAVRNFSLCAALAVLLDFILQVTMFVAFLSLDLKRMEAGRLDLAPCITAQQICKLTGKGKTLSPQEERDYGGLNGLEEDGEEVPRLEASFKVPLSGVSLQGALQWYMEHVHAPWLMKGAVQLGVLLLTLTGLFLSFSAIPKLTVGLDQAVALPRDSYLQKYYKDVMSYLRVGPPLYFVVRNLNLDPTLQDNDVNRVCSVAGCQQDSLMTRISQAAQVPSVSYIATPAASWLDDFLSWTNPALPHCCRYHPREQDPTYCPPPDQPPCSTSTAACKDCQICITYWEGGRPNISQYQQLLPWFLKAKPSAQCSKGGAGAYNDAIMGDDKDYSGVAGLRDGVVKSSSFRTYYTPLNHQSDFINAMKAVKEFTHKAKRELKLDIFTYSIFHIFFEQYLHVDRDAVMLIGTPCLAVFLACWLFTSSLWGSLLLLLHLVSLLLHLLGTMYLADIQLNAVSLVNLAMALGIAVEFCAHILHAFMLAEGTRKVRARKAILAMGASVTSGITLTKFAGVIVLAFSQTQIFQVYYFRLYLCLVLLGAFHGLVVLPVVLSLVGPPSWSERVERPWDPDSLPAWLTWKWWREKSLALRRMRRGHRPEREAALSTTGG